MKRLLFVLVFSLLTGCGTGYYDGLYRLHLKELESVTRFAELWPGGGEIPGTNLVIRVPKVFGDKVYNKNSVYSEDPHGEINPERLNPPDLNPFPGLVNCREVFQKDPSGANLPVYLYTGVRQLNAAAKAALQEEIQAKLKTVAPEAAWDDVRPAANLAAGHTDPLEEDRSENAADLLPGWARQGRRAEAARRFPALVV